MRLITAIAIWPIVYILDFIIYLTGAQSFKKSRRLSHFYFKRILYRTYYKHALSSQSAG